jgi:hypothetical protein
MKLRSVIALSLPLIGSSVMAANLAVKLDIPQLNVAEYHRPYLALWLEDPDQKFVANLAVLYDVKKKDHAGAKWLKDMRQWWRKSGRDLTLPIDGVSGATRAPGSHTLTFAGAQPALDKLPAGQYQVVVEAARESGGRELVRVPIQWPPKTALTVPAKGVEELGNIVVQLKP